LIAPQFIAAIALAAAQDAHATRQVGADGHERRPAQDIVSYEVDVDLRGTEPVVITTIDFVVTEPLDHVELDYAGPRVREVWAVRPQRAPPTPLECEWHDGRLSIHAELHDGVRSFQPRDCPDLRIVTDGWPSRGLFRTKNKFGETFVFTDAWPSDTRYWMPCEDHPSDKARFGCTLHMPAGWHGVSNGESRSDWRAPGEGSEVSAEGEGTERDGVTESWRSSAPIYTAVMSFAAGPFQIVSGGPFKLDPAARERPISLQWWLYPQDAAAGAHDFDVHWDALHWLDTTVGPYPYAKYAVVQIPTLYGGVENASNTFLRDAAIDGTGANASILVHELCHQWFGDSVTEEDWHDLWLSEGFATYFAAVTMDAIGKEPLAPAMAEMRRTIFAAPEVRSRPICDEGFIDPKQRLDANSYLKGGWFLHALRHEVGDDAFFRGIRRYYADHRDGNATSDDLRRAMETETGAGSAAAPATERRSDLTDFFDRGLKRAGFPIVKGDLAVKEGRLLARWSQRNAAPGEREPWPLRFELALGRRDAAGFTELRRATVVFATADAESSFELPPGVAPSDLAVRADPDAVVLVQFELRGVAVAE
jgi:aminopeptidase N